MRNRVLISDVLPRLDGGKYFIKKTVGEQVAVSAVIFADGDDELRAKLLHKHSSDKKWGETPMNPGDNDAWSGSFLVEKEGFYQFKIEAWVATEPALSSVFDEKMQVRVGRSKEMFSTWYLMFPRSAGEKAGVHGSFKDTERLLPRLSELGFDTLLLPPIFPVGVTNRKGKGNAPQAAPGAPGAPWAVGNKDGGHTSVHPELGSLDDFKALLKNAANQGIEVALDIALRCSPDHPWMQEHPDWFHRNADGSLAIAENPPFSYGDAVNFNFVCEDWKNLWDTLLAVWLFWAEQGVRVFHSSAPNNKPFAFWQFLIREVQAKYPDAVFCAGAYTRPRLVEELAKSGFSQSCTYFMWKNTQAEFKELLGSLTGSSKDFLRPNFFVNTPDILPANLAGASENAFMLRYALAATLSSNCGIYGPAFELMDNVPEAEGVERYANSEKYELRQHDWAARNRLMDFMRQLNQIRRENPALQQTFNISFSKTDRDDLLSFVKVYGENRVWCVVNLNPKEPVWGHVEVPKEALGIKGRWFNLQVTELLTGETYHWFNDWNFVELKPERFPMHVLMV